MTEQRDGHVFYGSKIYQTASRDSSVEALAVVGGVVVGEGSVDDASAAATAAGATQVRQTDLGGGTVIPGLVDSHVHTAYFGLTKNWVDCRPAAVQSIDELVALLAPAAAAADGKAWVRGWGYDDTLLADNRHPTRDDLDRASREVPIVISHVSGHFAVGNSRALELAGIDASSSDPDSGSFIKDDAGKPTGLMWEVGAVRQLIGAAPAVTPAELESAIEHGLHTAAACGMTTVHDLGVGLQGGAQELAAFRAMNEAGRLRLKVFGYLVGELAASLLPNEPKLFEKSGTDDYFVIQGAKFWSDGSIQGLSAALLEPYHCNHDDSGELLIAADEFEQRLLPIMQAGGQIAIHANGDRAIATVLEVYQNLAETSAWQTGRHRIEHFQMAHPEHVQQAAQIGAGVSVFANHIRYWGDRHRDRFVGPERASRMEPLRDVIGGGLHFGLHSDCPITPMDPLDMLWTAVNRRTSSNQVLGADQCITVEEAIHSLTLDSAWLVGREATMGSLQMGMAADFVVLDADLHDDDPDIAQTAQPVATYVDGVNVYSA